MRRPDPDHRCMASICQVAGYGNGHIGLDGRPSWGVTWLEDSPAGARVRRFLDYCSAACREYGSADTIEKYGEQVPGSYRLVDPPPDPEARDEDAAERLAATVEAESTAHAPHPVPVSAVSKEWLDWVHGVRPPEPRP